MRKFSNIVESAWGEMRKRSSGETIRKEDDVNLLDRDGLYDYLTSHYKNTNSFDPIHNSDAFDTIIVPFLIQGGSDGVYLDFKKNEVYIPYSSPYKVKGLFSKLANEFSLKSDVNTEYTWYIISPKDGSEVTNAFFIYVIDFLIDNIPDSFEKGVEKIVTESAWGEMRKRSSGEHIRKEDDINLLDKDNFYDYLKSTYSSFGFEFGNKENMICLPILAPENVGGWAYNLTLNYPDLYITLAEDFNDYYPILYKKLQEEYLVKIEQKRYISVVIYPKDGGKTTNQFFINVLDFIIENADNKKELMVKKKVIEESAWGEMRKRSSGDSIRKENQGKFYKYFEEIKKIPDDELIQFNSRFDTILWTPYNLGSNSVSEPGLYLNGEDIMELAEFLKGTEYHIATQGDWQLLSYKPFTYEKKDGNWTYIFPSTNGVLYVPNFGYISSYYSRHPEEDPIAYKPKKSDRAQYGSIVWGRAGFSELDNYKGYFGVKYNTSPEDYTDMFQVRLVKGPGHIWKNKS